MDCGGLDLKASTFFVCVIIRFLEGDSEGFDRQESRVDDVEPLQITPMKSGEELIHLKRILQNTWNKGQ